MTPVLIIAAPLVLIAIGIVNSASISNNYGSNIRLPIDCGDIDIKRGSGVYTIYPQGYAINVFCDMETENVDGGWTVFQRRINGDVNFYRGWTEYKAGFGTLEKEHCLGNDKLHKLTAQGEYELLITMQDFGNQKRYARYSNFKIGNEATKFNMTYSKFTGDVGDSLKHHNGHGFTTKDQDNDSNSGNCAVSYKGAWWYGTCHDSNLNGQYLGGEHSSDADGVNWNQWKGYHYSLKATSMMLRRME